MAKSGDQAILEIVAQSLEGVAAAFGSNCEVVLHTFDDLNKSVVRIINGHVTGRAAGSPITNLGIEILEKAKTQKVDVVGPYFSRLDDGRMLRCVTSIIRNPTGKMIGMMCVNIDVSVPVVDFFSEFLRPGAEVLSNSVEHFSSTPGDMISRVLAVVREDVARKGKMSPVDKNRMIVDELYVRGIFNLRGSVDAVAEEFCVSRATIYNYLRDIKKSGKSKSLKN